MVLHFFLLTPRQFYLKEIFRIKVVVLILGYLAMVCVRVCVCVCVCGVCVHDK